MAEADGNEHQSDQDDLSSRSSQPNSTSTYEYSHEPYETFQDKVLAIVRTISDCDDVFLQRLRGGSYNRVVIAKLRKEKDSVRGIFRTPRFTDVTGPIENAEGTENERLPVEIKVLDQAAVLQLLASRGVSAPGLLAFDASAQNAIQAPYALRQCSDGSPLDKIYGTMSLDKKLGIVRELVHVLAKAETIEFLRSGILVAEQAPDMATTASHLFGKEGTSLPVKIKPFANDDSTALTGLISIKRYEHLEQERKFGSDSPIMKMWERLRDIHDEMQARGLFRSPNKSATSLSHSVLYPWDLEPRNILVKPTESGTKWTIDMVIDWDGVQAVPAVLARKPPIWLWDFSSDDHASIASAYDGDVDLLSATRYDRASGKLRTEYQQIRKAFEEQFVAKLAEWYDGYDMEAYQNETYGAGCWIRRLARFAIHGASDSQDLKRFEHLDEEWTAHCLALDAVEMKKDISKS